MRRPCLIITLTLFLSSAALSAQTSYLGFDRNIYPGDANLNALHQTFSYSGYWLNNPPGERENTWAGHRTAVQSAGLGFLVLFNGRMYGELKSVANAKKFGASDAQAAVAAARHEGFPAHTIIFLDQEQGGRMLPEQKAYIYAWVDAVTAAGFGAGVYCSGIAAKDDGHVVTAEQFAQSPRRTDVATHCSNYFRDGNCYPPGVPAVPQIHLDIDIATSPDPSHGRSH